MTVSKLLAELNTLRAANNQKPLKRWSASRAALVDAIDALKPKARRHSDLADYCRDNGLDPKVQRAKARRKGYCAPFDMNNDEFRAEMGWK